MTKWPSDQDDTQWPSDQVTKMTKMTWLRGSSWGWPCTSQSESRQRSRWSCSPRPASSLIVSKQSLISSWATVSNLVCWVQLFISSYSLWLDWSVGQVLAVFGSQGDTRSLWLYHWHSLTIAWVFHWLIILWCVSFIIDWLSLVVRNELYSLCVEWPDLVQ